VKVEIIHDYNALTTNGRIRIISAGTALDLREDKALKLIAAGVAKPIGPESSFNPASLPYVDNRGRLVIPFDCPPRFRYWQGGQSLRDTLKELFEERAAIMEHSGGLTREVAEEEAARIMTRYVRDNSENGGDK
jgi:hypothetical protein